MPVLWTLPVDVWTHLCKSFLGLKSLVRLDTALQKNQEKVIAEVLGKLRDDKNYQVQADALRTLGKNYAAQVDVQRQYLGRSNAVGKTAAGDFNFWEFWHARI